MKDQKITRASLLQSKAKMMADRNERFAVIEMEIAFLKEDVSKRLTDISEKINNVLYKK